MSETRGEDLLGPLNAVERRHAPPTLWTLGDRGLLRQQPRVAVVGTRTPTKDGAHRAARLVRELVAARTIVVSGLAAGVDTIAHTRTIELGGRTIAVIGTAVDDVYPRRTRRSSAGSRPSTSSCQSSRRERRLAAATSRAATG